MTMIRASEFSLFRIYAARNRGTKLDFEIRLFVAQTTDAP